MENEENAAGENKFSPCGFSRFPVRFAHRRPAKLAAQERRYATERISGTLLVFKDKHVPQLWVQGLRPWFGSLGAEEAPRVPYSNIKGERSWIYSKPVNN